MKPLPILTLAGLCATAATLSAQVQMPGLTGFQRLSLPGNSDSFISTPYARPEAASGLVLNITGNDVAFRGTPGWTPGQFVYAAGTQPDHYYLLIQSGPAAGASYPITASAAGTVTVDTSEESLATVAAGHRAAIIPHWTLGTLFPGGSGVHPSSTPANRATEVMFPNQNATTINSSPTAIFYYFSGSWREIGQGTALRDDTIVFPDSYLIVRHNIAASTQYQCQGAVIRSSLRSPIGINPAAKRDNHLALQRPAETTLGASGLISSGAFAASPSPGVRTDELLVFDNALARKNKSASAIYYYWNSAWRKVGGGTASFDNAAVFTPGSGLILRKNTAGVSPTWINIPNY
jgi:uncharacterized protein (TIGR02597 family)